MLATRFGRGILRSLAALKAEVCLRAYTAREQLLRLQGYNVQKASPRLIRARLAAFSISAYVCGHVRLLGLWVQFGRVHMGTQQPIHTVLTLSHHDHPFKHMSSLCAGLCGEEGGGTRHVRQQHGGRHSASEVADSVC